MSKSILAFIIVLLFNINEISAQDQKIFVTRVKNPDNSVDFNYIKSDPGNYFIEFQFESLINAAESFAKEKVYNLNLSADSGTLFRLYPADSKKEILCSYTYSYKRGQIKPKVDNSVVYFLPFKENKNITIYEGTRFNVKPEIWKSYVVYSKTKDSIFAMRKGVVADIRKFTVTNNGSTSLRTEIIIDHADGTSASYSGIDDKLLNVKLNDIVYPGSRIGVMDDNINNDQNYNFKFNVYYFSDEEVSELDGRKVKIIERSLMPAFLTADGLQNLTSDKTYIVKHNDNFLFQEMTTEEQQKYKSQTNG